MYVLMWRVLAMLRRFVCAGAHHFSPHHTTYFCCAAASCACPSMRKHRDLRNSNLDNNPSYIYVHSRIFNENVDVCYFREDRDTMRKAQRYNCSNSRQHHVCARDVSSLCCDELLESEPVIYHPTIPHFSAVLPLRARGHRCVNIGNFVIVI